MNIDEMKLEGFLSPDEIDFPRNPIQKHRKLEMQTRRGNFNEAGSSGATPLHKVAEVQRNDQQIRDLTRANKARIDQQDGRGWTAMHIAASLGNLSALNIFFNEGGANPALFDMDGKTPRMLADECRHRTAAHFLEGLEQIFAFREKPFKHAEEAVHSEDKSLVNLQGNAKRPPIFECCVTLGGDALLKNLIIKGADINAQDEFGKTPLHVAIEADNASAVEILLEAGARTDLLDIWKLKAGDYARGNRHKVREILPEHMLPRGSGKSEQGAV